MMSYMGLTLIVEYEGVLGDIMVAFFLGRHYLPCYGVGFLPRQGEVEDGHMLQLWSHYGISTCPNMARFYVTRFGGRE